jgi:hemolysin III
MEATKEYSVGHEVANSVTHGLAAVLSIVGLVLLVVTAARTGDPWRITSAAIYGGSMILLFLMSTLYHAFPWPRVKHFFRLLDHSAIFLLIAGSYTPFLLVAARGTVAWILFGIVWTIAIGGIVFEIVLLDRIKWLTIVLYVGMGWVGVLFGKMFFDALSAPALIWLAAGGLAYTTGVIFYKWKGLPFHHAIWHGFVVAGAVCHWVSIYAFVMPQAT